MPADYKLELVVAVEVDKANQSIKSVNASLSSMEASATKSAKGATQGIDGMTAAMVKGATAGSLFADAIKSALGWAKEFTVGSVMMAAENAKAEASLKALATAHGVGAAAASKHVAAIEEIGFEFTEAAHAVQPERCDSPFRYSFSMTGYSCERANARDRLCGSTVVGAAFWIEPGMGLRGQQTGTHLERGHLPPPRIRRRYGRAVAPVYSRKRSIYFGVTVSCLRSFTLT